MNGNEPLLTYEQSRELDRKTMAAGWSSAQLMGQAALSSLYRLMQKPAPEEIVILCGPGNNGGDGLALAYHILSSAAQGGFAANCRLTVVQTTRAKSEASQFYQSLLQDRLPVLSPDELLNETPSPGWSQDRRGNLLIVEAAEEMA